MSAYLRHPDDVYWYFRRLAPEKQIGAERASREDGYLYRVNQERVICRVVNGKEESTIKLATRSAPGDL